MKPYLRLVNIAAEVDIVISTKNIRLVEITYEDDQFQDKQMIEITYFGDSDSILIFNRTQGFKDNIKAVFNTLCEELCRLE